MDIIIYALGIIATIALTVYGVLYSSNKFAAIGSICLACICYVASFCMYLQKSVYPLIVSPPNRYINPGFSEIFSLKIVNSKDTPLYEISLLIRIEEGDLSIDDIELKMQGKDKILSNVGGNMLSHDLIGFSWEDEKGRVVEQLIIYDIDPKSSKEFLVNVNGDKIKQRSKVVFEIDNYSLEPARVFSFLAKIQTCSENDNFEIACEKGQKLLDQGNFTEAIEYFKRTIRLNPSSICAHINLGNAYYSVGKNNSAIKEWNTAIKFDPSNPKAHFNLGVLFMDSKDFNEAIQQFEYTSNLDHPMIKYNSLIALGICLKRLNQQKKAYEKYQLAINFNPKYAAAYYQWGVDLLEQGLYIEAINKFKRVSELDSPIRLDAFGLWGAVLEKMDKDDEAIEKYKEVINLAPNSAQAIKSRNSIRNLTEKMKNN